MTRKIEITDQAAKSAIEYFLQGLNSNGSIYLMTGPIPIDNGGLVPWGYDVLVQEANYDGMTPGELAVVPIGTYTGNSYWWGRGLTSTVTLTVTENNQFDLQINSTGKLSPFNWDWWNDFGVNRNPLGLNISWDTEEGFQLPLTITWKLYNHENLLVQWEPKKVKVNDNGVVSTFAAAAGASGTATWFFIKDSQNVMIGTIGLTGSGADLELDDVNIVQGKTYGIRNLRIQMPTVFEY